MSAADLEDHYQILHKTDQAINCSILKDGLFSKSYTKWMRTYFKFFSDGSLSLLREPYLRSKDKLVEFYRVNISVVRLKKIEIDRYLDESMLNYITVKLSCKDLYGIEAVLRLVFASEDEFNAFMDAIARASADNNVAAFRTSLAESKQAEVAPKKANLFRTMSLMKRSVHHVINKAEKRSTREMIVSR